MRIFYVFFFPFVVLFLVMMKIRETLKGAYSLVIKDGYKEYERVDVVLM